MQAQLLLLLGDPGTGKSLLALHLAAQLSRTLPLPFPILPLSASVPECLSAFSHASPTPASSIICSNEDSPDTIRSRLLAANANLDLIAYNSHLSLDPPPRACSDPPWLHPTPLLKYLDIQLRLLPNPKLLILDPLPSFLGPVDGSNHPGAITRALQPLLDRAQHHRFAILGIHHLAKSPRSKNPLHHSLGSPIYADLSHSVYLLDATAGNDQPRTLTPLKSPTSNPPTLSFSIISQSPPSPAQGAPTITWHSETTTPIPAELSAPPAALPLTAFDIAIHFLQAALTPNPIPSKTLQTRARRAGITPRTLRRARRHLGIQSRHNGQHWLTTLPPTNARFPYPTHHFIP